MTTPSIDTSVAVGPVTDPAPSGFDRALHAQFTRLTVRPRSRENSQWKLLQFAFGRIRTALKEHTS
jgi:hypothetical protein